MQNSILDNPAMITAGAVADRLGVRAYLVGGVVRDMLLNRPLKDVDIVVEGSGVDYAQALATALDRPAANVFKNFGTAQIPHTDFTIEIVGARTESYRAASRNPEVSIGTIEQDRMRRDFTINAMGISLNGPTYGELDDPFNGIQHLQDRLIDTPLDPQTTFNDDPLRMLRALRFAAQLEFTVSERCLKAINEMGHRIAIVSRERIADELNKMIMAPVPSVAFIPLFQTGVLKLIFPRMAALHGVKVQNGIAHKDNFYHTLKVLDNVAARSNDLWLRWAAIMHDIAKPDTQRFEKGHGWTFHGHEDLGAKLVPAIFRDLKLPLDQSMRFVQKLVRLHLRPIALSKETVTDSGIRRLIFEAGDDLDALMTLCESDITSKDDARVARYLRNFEKVRQKCAEVLERDNLRQWQPPVDGAAIMQRYGLGPSREVGELKTKLREAILDGHVNNDFNSALTYLDNLALEMGREPIEK